MHIVTWTVTEAFAEQLLYTCNSAILARGLGMPSIGTCQSKSARCLFPARLPTVQLDCNLLDSVPSTSWEAVWMLIKALQKIKTLSKV